MANAPGAAADVRDAAKRDRLPSAGTIGYAMERRIRSWMKLAWYDDRGVIESIPGGIRFVGRKEVTVMQGVRSVEIIGPVRMTMAFVLFGNALVLTMAALGAFQLFTLANPLTYLMLGVINWIGPGNWPMRWVRVEYGTDRLERAYLTPALSLSRWSGGTERLAAQIRAIIGQDVLSATDG
jgi:hypothetical protein